MAKANFIVFWKRNVNWTVWGGFFVVMDAIQCSIILSNSGFESSVIDIKTKKILWQV